MTCCQDRRDVVIQSACGLDRFSLLCVLAVLCAPAQTAMLAEAINMPGATITTAGSDREASRTATTAIYANGAKVLDLTTTNGGTMELYAVLP